MTKSNENYSGAKNSNATVTPDCESVSPLAQLSQTNNSFLPTKIGHQTAGMESHIEGDIRDHSVEGNSQNSEQNDGEGILGNNVESSNIQNGTNLSSQTNNVENNHGITGISGTGHTITVNQCPDELIQLLIKLIKKL
ncbi:MAG: hypothetical protein LBL07_15425 [Tannerella sp.]|jgi:hypothetical protein|nr:hypothetical protein [Tannerella sp.]